MHLESPRPYLQSQADLDVKSLSLQSACFYHGNWLLQLVFVAGMEISAQFVKVFSGPLTVKGSQHKQARSRHSKSPLAAGAPALRAPPTQASANVEKSITAGKQQKYVNAI